MSAARSHQARSVGTRAAKNALFDAFASVAKALSSGRRAEILELLAQGERSVEQVAEAIDQSVANTSHHLRVLATAGLVRSRRDGNHVRYRLAGNVVAEFWAALRIVAANQVAEVEWLARAYLGERDEREAIGHEELIRRLDDLEVIVLDVRPRLEYESGHIAGSRSVPLDEFDDALGTLPEDVEIVAYCRGPYCVYADEAVRRLRAAGYRARRLEDGYPEWQRRGLPVTPAPDAPPGAVLLR
ncbi:MAG: metalloregulator ArsR/SmtB family transcription factor [Nitriliruptorales bacterium]|nr:metalloregulator ArsR/SmtB family transcription factor [Nitriliruptorales bacterium]